MSMIGNFLRISPTQLDALLADPAAVPAFVYDGYRKDPTAEHLDIDKSWHIIHFLLAGDPWQGAYPLSAVVLSVATVGEEDVGYGPARYLSAQEVQTVAAAVAAVSDDQLWERFDANRVADIYPQCWTEGTEEDRQYVLGYFASLKEFYAAATKSGQAMLQFLS